jgi:hypothetical protein
MSRCYGCSQENCGRTVCSCSCHAPKFNYFQTPSESAAEIKTHAEMNRKLLEASAPVCPTHKRYQAKRKPRAQCEPCWRRYIHLNPTGYT